MIAEKEEGGKEREVMSSLRRVRRGVLRKGWRLSFARSIWVEEMSTAVTVCPRSRRERVQMTPAPQPSSRMWMSLVSLGGVVGRLERSWSR